MRFNYHLCLDIYAYIDHFYFAKQDELRIHYTIGFIKPIKIRILEQKNILSYYFEFIDITNFVENIQKSYMHNWKIFHEKCIKYIYKDDLIY